MIDVSHSYGGKTLANATHVDAIAASIAGAIRGHIGGPAGSGERYGRRAQAQEAAPALDEVGEELVVGRRYPLTEAQEAAEPQSDEQARIERDPSKGYVEVIESTADPIVPTVAESAGYSRALEDGVAGTVVAVGKAVWEVMKDNQPVTDASSDYASVIPRDATLEQVTGWNPDPHHITVLYHSADLLELNTTDLYLTVSWYFNGQYAGAGQYIDAATVLVSGETAWGNHVNISATIRDPINLGTSDAPIAALPIRIRLSESNTVQSLSYAYEAQVRGNGAGRIVRV